MAIKKTEHHTSAQREAVKPNRRVQDRLSGTRTPYVAHSLAGRAIEAKEKVPLMLAGNLDFSVSHRIANMLFESAEASQAFTDGLRLAGWPD